MEFFFKSKSDYESGYSSVNEVISFEKKYWNTFQLNNLCFYVNMLLCVQQ
jgi:hypothetical protein